jgi:hypothetical protein
MPADASSKYQVHPAASWDGDESTEGIDPGDLSIEMHSLEPEDSAAAAEQLGTAAGGKDLPPRSAFAVRRRRCELEKLQSKMTERQFRRERVKATKKVTTGHAHGDGSQGEPTVSPSPTGNFTKDLHGFHTHQLEDTFSQSVPSQARDERPSTARGPGPRRNTIGEMQATGSASVPFGFSAGKGDGVVRPATARGALEMTKGAELRQELRRVRACTEKTVDSTVVTGFEQRFNRRALIDILEKSLAAEEDKLRGGPAASAPAMGPPKATPPRRPRPKLPPGAARVWGASGAGAGPAPAPVGSRSQQPVVASVAAPSGLGPAGQAPLAQPAGLALGGGGTASWHRWWSGPEPEPPDSNRRRCGGGEGGGRCRGEGGA